MSRMPPDGRNGATRSGPGEHFWDAERVRTLRRLLALTQDEFAARLGTTQQTVSEWEVGKHRPRRMSAAMLARLAADAGLDGMREGSLAALDRRPWRME